MKKMYAFISDFFLKNLLIHIHHIYIYIYAYVPLIFYHPPSLFISLHHPDRHFIFHSISMRPGDAGPLCISQAHSTGVQCALSGPLA